MITWFIPVNTYRKLSRGWTKTTCRQETARIKREIARAKRRSKDPIDSVYDAVLADAIQYLHIMYEDAR